MASEETQQLDVPHLLGCRMAKSIMFVAIFRILIKVEQFFLLLAFKKDHSATDHMLSDAQGINRKRHQIIAGNGSLADGMVVLSKLREQKG